MHRALIVAAVSTIAQAADDKASIPQQLEDCRRVCLARNWPVIREIIIPGHSRSYNWLHELVRSCPEYGELVDCIASGDISLLVVRDYDRLWRTDALRAQVTALCREHGVQVYALNQPAEPLAIEKLAQGASDSAMILEAIGGVISESENRTRVRRSLAGRHNIIRQGFTQFTAGNCPYGYRKVLGSNLIEQNPEQAQWVRWIYERRVIDRWSYYRIASRLTELGVLPVRGPNTRWHDHTINRMLANPVYKGAIEWGGIYNEQGKHEPIVSSELWQAAQDVPPTREHNPSRPVLPLTGLVVCGYCGYAQSYTIAVHEKRHRLRCSNFTRSHGQRCQCNSVYAAVVEAYVYDGVREVLSNPLAFLEFRLKASDTEKAASDLDDIKRQLEDLQARYARWSTAYEMGSITIDELQGHRARLGAQSAELQQRTTIIRQTLVSRENREKTLTELTPLLADMGKMSVGELNQLYRRLILHVRYKRGEPLEIVWL